MARSKKQDNPVFRRCLEELEKHLSPRRAGEVLFSAIAQVGATPENVTLGHLVRAADLTLTASLAPHCDGDAGEAQRIAQDVAQLLNQLASQYFGKS